MNTETKKDDQPKSSEETQKSLKSGEAVIELNKKLAGQEGKDGEEEEKKDRKKWTTEG